MSESNVPIENHYHIKELIDAQTIRANDREYHRNLKKEKDERVKLIEDAKLVVLTDFWCNLCKQDFKSMAARQFEVDWSNPAQYIAYYKAKCDRGHWCIRLITDKQRDGYWTRSRLVNIEKGIFHNDTLQPHQTGYNMLYKKI